MGSSITSGRFLKNFFGLVFVLRPGAERFYGFVLFGSVLLFLTRFFFSDNTACLDSIIEDSRSLQVSGSEQNKSKRIELNVVEPAHELPIVKKEQSIIHRYFRNKCSLIDGAIYNGRRTRVGWASG